MTNLPTPQERKASTLLGHIFDVFNVPPNLEELYRQRYDLPIGRESREKRARRGTQNLFGGQYDENDR